MTARTSAGLRVLVIVALLIAACTPSASSTSERRSEQRSETAASPGASAPSQGAPTASVPALAGIGDPLFPHLGNRGYDVTHYELDLAVDPQTSVLDATVTIDAVATDDLTRFFLDFVGFDITDVTVDGAPADVSRTAEELEVVPSVEVPAGRAFTTVISYGGSAAPLPSDADVGSVGWRRNPEGVNYVASEPDGAHAWFPSNDHPLDKATFRTAVTVAEPAVAAANGVLIATEDAPGQRTYVWEMDQPMAPYLATVVVGDMQIVEDDVAAATAGLPIRHVLPPADAALPPDGLDRIGDMIAFLEPLFGPFPFDTYGIAVIDSFGAALETQTLSVVGRPPGQARLDEGLLTHEIAHEWFGNSVSLERWEDLWLKEGLATYAGWMWVAEQTADPEATLRARARDAADLVASVDAPPAAMPESAAIYTPGAYEGGALALHALRDEVGDDTFFAILRTFADRFAYGNAGTDDFVGLAEQVADRDLDDLFDAWLYQRARPSVR